MKLKKDYGRRNKFDQGEREEENELHLGQVSLKELHRGDWLVFRCPGSRYSAERPGVKILTCCHIEVLKEISP